MRPAKSRFHSNRGFSLVEVLIAMGLLTTVSLGVAQLFAASTNANRVARNATSTTSLAEQKMEQLRSLTWGFDLQGLGLPLTDTTTNLATYPHTPDGGGLNPSPEGTLVRNIEGYVDYLDASGAYLDTGETPPSGTVFIRRWAVLPLPTNPNNTLILQVLVTTVANENSRTNADPDTRIRMPGDAMLISVKTRKAS